MHKEINDSFYDERIVIAAGFEQLGRERDKKITMSTKCANMLNIRAEKLSLIAKVHERADILNELESLGFNL